jgi:hypothetical protein
MFCSGLRHGAGEAAGRVSPKAAHFHRFSSIFIDSIVLIDFHRIFIACNVAFAGSPEESSHVVKHAGD